ncbi:hypothetical protein N8252_04305 [Ulvibacter sp.]|nr:hypothetical protein [Ulvibacter sp.]MDC1327530.1 hypothetical protein [Ulvibacter sp.]|tara:strand:- start:482 stop:853 length:372 start_codon:yes stop_codon:yes gene_type:complete
MKFVHRLGFYAGGFVIGLMLLFFFLNGKRTSCDYGPEARTLKNIKLKQLVFSNEALQEFSNYKVDTAAISIFLKQGDVLFSESDTSLDSCKQYVIRGLIETKKYKIRVENCEMKATVLEFSVN